MATLSDLSNAVAAVCPIVGVEGNIDDPDTWKIDFDPSATDAQKVAGQQVRATFDPAAVFIVTMRQARLSLIEAGLYDKVNAAVNAADAATQVWWEYSTFVERNNPILNTIAVQLGVTSSQMDGLFKIAAGL